MLRQTIMIITNVLVSVSLSQTKNWTYFCPPLFARQKYFWSILTNTRYVSGQVTLMWTQTVESWDTLNTIQCVWQFVSRHDDVWGVSPSFPYWCHQSLEPQCSRLSLWPQAETGARWHEGGDGWSPGEESGLGHHQLETESWGMSFRETMLRTKGWVSVACGQKLCKFVANRESF